MILESRKSVLKNKFDKITQLFKKKENYEYLYILRMRITFETV